jgi:tetratricopeptide (TPR) repeat protein
MMTAVHRFPGRPTQIAVLVLALFAGQFACGDDKPERLTPEQWRKLAEESNAMRLRAVELARKDKHAEAAELNAELLKTYERLFPSDQFSKGHTAWAAGLGFQAGMLLALKREREAIPFAERAIAMFDKLYPPAEHPNGQPHADSVLDLLGTLHYNCGGAAFMRHDLREAQRHFQCAVRAYERRFSPSRAPKGSKELALAYNGLAGAHVYAGEHHLAATYLKKALAIQEHLNTKPSSDLARSLNNLGSLLRDQGEFTEARPYLERSAAIFQALDPEGQADRGVALNNLGVLYHALGDDKKAAEALTLGLPMLRRAYPDGHPDLVGCLISKALVSSALGDAKAASELTDEALKFARRIHSKKEFPNGDVALAMTIHNAAALKAESGQLDSAEELFREAVTITANLYAKTEHPDGHPQVAMTHQGLGTVLLKNGKADAARAELEKALDMYQGWASNVGGGVSEAEALNVVGRLNRARDLFLQATRPASPVDDSSDSVYAHVWRSKASVTQIVETRQQILARTTNVDARQLWDRLIETRITLSRMATAPVAGDPKQDEAHRQRLREVVTLKEELEGQLARLPEVAQSRKLARRPHTDLVRDLPAGTAFIDFARYRADAPARTEKGTVQSGELRYVAFVVRPGKAVVRVELGRAEGIDKEVWEWRESIQRGRATDAAAIVRAIWEPLRPYLAASLVLLTLQRSEPSKASRALLS